LQFWQKSIMNRFLAVIFSAALTVPVLAVGVEPLEITPHEFSKKKLSDLNRRSRYPFGLNIYGFGPVGVGALTADWFMTPKLALELGAGFRDMDFHNGYTVGVRYHIFGKTMMNMTPYVGVYTAFHHNGATLQNHNLYVPAGIHRIKKNGFNWSVEVAWQRNTFFSNGIIGGFRIGYRFKTKRLVGSGRSQS
jgi:hypothetical protein